MIRSTEYGPALRRTSGSSMIIARSLKCLPTKDHRLILVFFRFEFHDRRTSNFLKFREKTRKRLEGSLAELQGRGIVRSIDEAAASELLSDLLFGVIHMQFIKRGNTPLKKQAPFIIDLFFRGILTGSGRKVWQGKQN